jgi:hypothetical protein
VSGQSAIVEQVGALLGPVKRISGAGVTAAPEDDDDELPPDISEYAPDAKSGTIPMKSKPMMNEIVSFLRSLDRKIFGFNLEYTTAALVTEVFPIYPFDNICVQLYRRSPDMSSLHGMMFGPQEPCVDTSETFLLATDNQATEPINTMMVYDQIFKGGMPAVQPMIRCSQKLNF